MLHLNADVSVILQLCAIDHFFINEAGVEPSPLGMISDFNSQVLHVFDVCNQPTLAFQDTHNKQPSMNPISITYYNKKTNKLRGP
jgi:hypothetical protein